MKRQPLNRAERRRAGLTSGRKHKRIRTRAPKLQTMVVPAGVADRDSAEDVETAKQMTHDLVVDELGGQRVTGVTWRVIEADDPRAVELVKIFFDPKSDGFFGDVNHVNGLLRFLEENPKGALVLASAEWDPRRKKSQRRTYGRRNIYVCDTCRGAIVTVDIDEGVTPSFLACRVQGEPVEGSCPGTMQSQWYPNEPWADPFPAVLARTGPGGAVDKIEQDVDLPEAGWEWYRPNTQLQLEELDHASLEHVSQGGLLLRRIEGAE